MLTQQPPQPPVSLSMLPYFRVLPRPSQRSLMRLLVDATLGPPTSSSSSPSMEVEESILQQAVQRSSLPPASPSTLRNMMDLGREVLQERAAMAASHPTTRESATTSSSSSSSAHKASGLVAPSLPPPPPLSSSSQHQHHHRRHSSGADMAAELDLLLMGAGAGGRADIALINDLESLFLSPGGCYAS